MDINKLREQNVEHQDKLNLTNLKLVERLAEIVNLDPMSVHDKLSETLAEYCAVHKTHGYSIITDDLGIFAVYINGKREIFIEWKCNGTRELIKIAPTNWAVLSKALHEAIEEKKKHLKFTEDLRQSKKVLAAVLDANSYFEFTNRVDRKVVRRKPKVE